MGLAKIIGFTVLSGVVIIGATYAYRAYETAQAGNKIEVVIKTVKVHKVDLTGIDIWTNIQLQNPTQTEISITQPFVRLTSKNGTVASSSVSSTTFNLAPLSNTDLETISIKIGMLQLISFLTQISFKFPTTADTIDKKITYLITEIATIVTDLALAIEYSTYANGFAYSAKQALSI